MKNKNGLRNYPVQIKPCRTCPFAGKEPIVLTPEKYQHYITNLMGNGQHFCHSVKNKAICRGVVTFNLDG